MPVARGSYEEWILYCACRTAHQPVDGDGNEYRIVRGLGGRFISLDMALAVSQYRSSVAVRLF